MTVGTKIIQVKPGMGAGTVLTFTGEGHQRPNTAQSDLVIMMA
jgi:DnaJ-class molecular chaperone